MTSSPLASLRVLLIDDDEDQFVLTREMLSGDPACAFEVQWCPTFEGAVRRLAAADCDVALIDYRLGSQTGLDVLRHDAVQLADVAAVMLTAEADPRVDREAMAAGAVDYLVKSEVTPQTLKRALRYAAERRRAQIALADSEARHRSTFDDAPIGMAQTALDGRWLNVNKRLLAMLGFSRAEMEAVHFAALTHPDDLEKNSTARIRMLAGELDKYNTEKRYRRKDGSYVWVKISVSPHRGMDGTPDYFISVIEDISERKKAQEEFDHIFNLSPDMIATFSFDGRFTRTNPAWFDALGYTSETLDTNPFIDFVHPDDQAATLREMEQLTEGKRVFGFSNRYRAADGSYRWIEWHSKTDPATQVIYAVARDQTARRLLEEQFRQAQKMEAVGRLAGGVAHDFNNLLTAIIGFSEMALAQLPPDVPIRDDVKEILHAGESAAALTKQLLAFSRKQVLAPALLDVNALVANMHSLLRRLIGEDVELEIAPCDQVSRIYADRGQFEQIIMNLAVNARDAMPSGGALRITTEAVDLDNAFVAAHPGSAAGPHVRISVRDTGIGMGADVLAHLFEPFFTTKEPGKGTGLGLATVYGIVTQSGGSISVESTPGQGTAFIIHFPQASAAEAAEVQAGAPRRPASGVETVLVVDDQPEVRTVVRHTLLKNGYRVLEAGDGRAALSLLQGHPTRVHLLLTDVVMPHMGGHELAERALAHDQSIRVMFTTGYLDNGILRPGVLHAGLDLINKPFTHDQLLTRVRAALDRPQNMKLAS